MAKRVRGVQDTVQRVWSARGLKPNLLRETFKLSNDPLFEDGVRLRRRGQTIGSRAARPARRETSGPKAPAWSSVRGMGLAPLRPIWRAEEAVEGRWSGSLWALPPPLPLPRPSTASSARQIGRSGANPIPRT